MSIKSDGANDSPSAVAPGETGFGAGGWPTADVATVAGVGPRRSAALRSRGINVLGDALAHLPYRYEDLRRRDQIATLRPGMTAVIEGTLQNVAQRPMRGMRWRRMATAFFKEASGKGIRVVWFNLHDGHLPAGERLILSGRVSAGSDGTLEMIHPDIHRLKAGVPPAIRPIYGLPSDVPQRLFGSIVGHAVAQTRGVELGAIPLELRAEAHLPSILEALKYLHQPPADADIDKLQNGDTAAHRALAIDEMFAFQLGLARERLRSRVRTGALLNAAPRLSAELMATLPFIPTTSQIRAIDEIAADLAAPSQMNRILIGDVGSGKTLVAFNAVLRAIESGWQAAVMAPTELLAEQHFVNFNRICGRLGVTAALLTGKVGASERARLLRALQRGDIGVVFGTHALIQEGVAMRRLGVAIIDEQHRFGVFDRARLMALGSQANVLLMTATPIPRSLALTLFRSLNVSTLDEMPPGRAPIATEVFAEEALPGVDLLVQAELEAGRRAYYVVPLIDGEEDPDSLTATAKRLGAGPLGRFSLGVLHGRMRPAEKDRIMREFRDGAVNVLVSTTVVEVGIDVPEASIIVVVAAERYGLAQLHQLRGRVGRGSVPSRCCLVVSSGVGQAALDRVEMLARTASGTEVAELDLKMRGPGDLFGARQTGALALRFADFIRDPSLIEQAGDMAEAWLARDPGLDSPASAGARAALARMMDFGFSLGDVG
ncbi:MAG TPA: ATP-dependent DNA helicase RecG [Candidatus Binataceae bacterium]|nr:ATP-dependent DNA helicase RecG [Candidatus Binataceae bacterium]